MRRPLLFALLLCPWMVIVAPAHALTIVAPAAGVTRQNHEIKVHGAAPFGVELHTHAFAGASCPPDFSGSKDRVSGPFEKVVEFIPDTPGPWVVCARLMERDSPDYAPAIERAAAVMEISTARAELRVEPVRDVVGVDEPFAIRAVGHSDASLDVSLWVHLPTGPACTERPWVGDVTLAFVKGPIDTRLTLEAIPVPGVYRVCAALGHFGVGDPIVETHLTVSQACTDARRTAGLRVASYRRARSVYRRSRGARRSRARPVMLRRLRAHERARAAVARDC